MAMVYVNATSRLRGTCLFPTTTIGMPAASKAQPPIRPTKPATRLASSLSLYGNDPDMLPSTSSNPKPIPPLPTTNATMPTAIRPGLFISPPLSSSHFFSSRLRKHLPSLSHSSDCRQSWREVAMHSPSRKVHRPSSRQYSVSRHAGDTMHLPPDGQHQSLLAHMVDGMQSASDAAMQTLPVSVQSPATRQPSPLRQSGGGDGGDGSELSAVTLVHALDGDGSTGTWAPAVPASALGSCGVVSDSLDGSVRGSASSGSDSTGSSSAAATPPMHRTSATPPTTSPPNRME